MAFSALSLGLTEDPGRPVFTAFVRACVQRWNTVAEILPQLLALPRDAPDTPRAVKDGMKKAARLLQEAEQLSTWLFPARKPMLFTDILALAKKMGEQGWELDGQGWEKDFAEGLFKQLQKHDVGRPNKRSLYVRAFELQLQSKKMTLGQAVRRVCDCGQQTHGVKCHQNIKAGIRSLKPLVRIHAPDLLQQYESLHPNRASLGSHRQKKVNG